MSPEVCCAPLTHAHTNTHSSVIITVHIRAQCLLLYTFVYFLSFFTGKYQNYAGKIHHSLHTDSKLIQYDSVQPQFLFNIFTD